MTPKSALICAVAVVFLEGCLAATGGGSLIGPGGSSQALESEQEDAARSIHRELEVAIPAFDPNLPENSDEWEKQGIWPELRRAESTHFAVRMKEALEATRQFGAVRVVPNQAATGDVYVLGTIKKSNGEDIGIHIKVVGIDGKVWLSKSFKHRVKEAFFKDIRNENKDPYQPVFEDAAAEIVSKLHRQKDEYLEDLNDLTEVRFGYSFSEESFSPFLKLGGGKAKLVAAPADDDAMLRRIRKLRVKDQLFIDRLQPHYDAFEGRLLPSYAKWQTAAFTEVKARRKAKTKAVLQAVVGTLVLVAGAVAAGNSSYDNPNYGAGAAVIAGGLLLLKAYETDKEAKFHYEALMELGQSIDVEIAPQVVEFEKKTVELTGNSKQQFDQWRKFLKEIYAAEKTPEIQL